MGHCRQPGGTRHLQTFGNSGDHLDGLDAAVLAESEGVFEVLHGELALSVVVDRSGPDGRALAQVLHFDFVLEVVHFTPCVLQRLALDVLIDSLHVPDAHHQLVGVVMPLLLRGTARGRLLGWGYAFVLISRQPQLFKVHFPELADLPLVVLLHLAQLLLVPPHFPLHHALHVLLVLLPGEVVWFHLTVEALVGFVFVRVAAE